MKFLSVLVAALLILSSGASAQNDRRLTLLNGGIVPTVDLNFTAGTMPGAVTFTRASSATDGLYTDAAGSSFNSFLTNVPRLSSSGFLAEESRTQQLLNSAAPVTQTTASLSTGTYVFWCIGTGSTTSSAGTATASGLGAITCSQGTIQTIIVTVAGTLTFTKSGSIDRFQLELGAFPTTFISSAGATATRAADAATVALSSARLPANPTALTIITKFTSPSVLIASKSYTAVEIDDGASNNRTVFRFSGVAGSTLQAITVSGGSAQFTMSAYTTPPTSTVMRAWVALSSGATAAQVIGQTKQTSAAATPLAAGQTTLRLGTSNGATESLSAPLARLQIYNTRLSDGRASSIAAGM